MPSINWLDLIVAILGAFGVYNLTLKEMSIYFQKKTHLSRWILCIIISFLMVILRIHIPASFTFLLILAVSGGVEILYILSNREQKKIWIGDTKAMDSRDDPTRVQKNKDGLLKGGEIVAQETKEKAEELKDQGNKPQAKGMEKGSPKSPKIINSSRLYNQQDFLSESKSGNIVLSDMLRASLDKPKDRKK